MKVLGEDEVRAAYRRGQRKVVADPRDIVTAQALDTVDRLGMRLLRAPAPLAQPLTTAPGRALSRTLYRRHPGFVASSRHTNVRSTRSLQVSVIGAGAIGAGLTNLLAHSGAVRHISLIDLLPGLAEGIAVDCSHAAALMDTSTTISGHIDYAAIAGADIVVVAPDTPGYDSKAVQLLGEVEMAANAIAAHAPDAIAVFAGWPNEVFTTELQRASNLPPERVIGTGATLASSRLLFAIEAKSGAARGEVEAVAFGADLEYTPILSSARLRGRPIRDAVAADTIAAAANAAADAASYVQSLRTSHVPAIAPAHAAAEVIDALRGARPGPIPVSVQVDDLYGIEGAVVGVSANLSMRGVESLIALPLEESETSALRRAAHAVREGHQLLLEREK